MSVRVSTFEGSPETCSGAAYASAVYRARKFVRRNRTRAIVGSVVAASLLAAVVGTTTFAVRERRRARETERVADFQARMLKDIEVRRMGDDLRQDILREAEEGWVRQRTGEEKIRERSERLRLLLADSNFTNTAIKDLDRNIFARTLPAIEREFADQPLLKARLLQDFAHVARGLRLLERAKEAQT